MPRRPLIFVAAAVAATLAAGCSSDDENTNPVENHSLAVACNDTLEAVYGDPGPLTAPAGSILRCAPDGAMTAEQIQTKLDAQSYVGEPMRSGARVYRVLYRTERAMGGPGYSAAMVYVPTVARAQKLPAIVVSHGSRGQAPHCAASIADPRAEQVNDDQERMVLTWVGAGFPVIAPDLAGFSNYGASGNPISGYNVSADVARSTLDGARAMRLLTPSMLSDQVVLTGHSQGGHTAFSALALADTYAPDVSITAVATFVPNWLSQRSWGALFALPAVFTFEKQETANVVSLWYHYTAAEVLDGPGRAADIVRPDKFEAVKEFVDSTCWGPPYPLLHALGTSLLDVFEPEFTEAVKIPAAFGAPCPEDEPGKSTCEKWVARYLADRPHLTGKAATVPILVSYGGKDDAITPNRFQCVIDRLEEDKANLEYCFDPEGMHGELPAQLGGYAIGWVAHKTLGEPLTAPCPSTEMNLVDDKGDPEKCETPPPND